MIPSVLRQLAPDPEFWNGFYFWEEHDDLPEYPQLAKCVCRFEVATGSALTLSLDKHLGYFSLGLESPRLPGPIEVAWDDQAHFHPDALRWSELESICRAVSAKEPELTHPGLPLLLLCRFAPICEGDDVDFIVSRLEAAWRAVAPMVPRRVVRARIEGMDRRQDGFKWVQETAGWVPTQPEGASGRLYSLRTATNLEFPFKEWSAFVAQAESLAKRSPSPPSPPSDLKLRRRHRIQISTLLLDPSLWRDLNNALSLADLGTASPGGGTMDAKGKRLSDTFQAEVLGDLEGGIAIIRDWLIEAKAPAKTTITCDGREIPLRP